jgi:hypothetical protein
MLRICGEDPTLGDPASAKLSLTRVWKADLKSFPNEVIWRLGCRREVRE